MSTNALGTDFYCADDVTEDLAIENDPRAAYLQAMYRRLAVAGLFYSDNYGLGVHRFILETGLTDLELRDAIRTELLKDERTRDVRVTLSERAIAVVCVPHDAEAFPLTLTIDRVSGALITGDS